jgi:hypothetical protein
MVEHHQATAAETFTLSISATDTANDGGIVTGPRHKAAEIKTP